MWKNRMFQHVKEIIRNQKKAKCKELFDISLHHPCRGML